MHRPVLVLALAAIAVATLSAQQPQQGVGQIPQATFRTGTRLVVHTVTVKDKDGKPVEGLTAKDFVVTENNEAGWSGAAGFLAEFCGLGGQVSQVPMAPDLSAPAVPDGS